LRRDLEIIMKINLVTTYGSLGMKYALNYFSIAFHISET